MLTVKGRVENGAVLPLEPISDFYEGKEVIMTLADNNRLTKMMTGEDCLRRLRKIRLT